MNYLLVCHNQAALPARFHPPGVRTLEFRFDRDLRNEGKWKNMRTLLHELRPEEDGDLFWFPDPDLAFEVAMPRKLFSSMREFKLDLAQPALTPDSVASHAPLIQLPDHLKPRLVPFVEIMCPCFSMPALRRNLWTFGLNYSGFGVDFLWGRKEKCHVLDWLTVRHPSSPGYGNTERNHGLPDPFRELTEIEQRYL